MIKTKAANVAPAEVEAVLTSRPDVRVAVVVGLPHEEWGQEVAAAIVPEDGHTIDVDEIRAELRTQISPYKVPTVLCPGRGGPSVPPELQGRPARLAAMLHASP